MKLDRETVIGAVVLMGMVLLLAVSAAKRHTGNVNGDGYRVEAVFNRTDGLNVGAPVRMAGVYVGRVQGQALDERFRAHVSLVIQPGIEIPQDSAAVIETDGLLGDKYIELQPGGMEEMLQPGQRIEYTQDAVVVEDLLAKIVAQAKAKREAAAQAHTSAGGAAGNAPAPFPSLFGEDGGTSSGQEPSAVTGTPQDSRRPGDGVPQPDRGQEG